MSADDANGGVPRCVSDTELTAQQTALVRSVLLGNGRYLRNSFRRDVQTGHKVVDALDAGEISTFHTRWNAGPVQCIRSMNTAIAAIDEPSRFTRYLSASFDLELLMDGQSPLGAAGDRVGIPAYLANGYTDLGFHASDARHRRRGKILVDKPRLRTQLLQSKREALAAGVCDSFDRERFVGLLRQHASSLRESLGYEENTMAEIRRKLPDQTVCLSACVERRTVACTHLSILLQLRLQESGIASRLVKGSLGFYGLKGRHAWNVAWRDGRVALVDATLADDDGPFVVVGDSIDSVYEESARRLRDYRPSPDNQNYYQIRRVPT